MSIYKSKKRIINISVRGKVLPGTISIAYSRCGKKNCACHDSDEPKLHGPYYRWTGCINGKPTTVTISEDSAEECRIRIKNYKRLMKKLERIKKKAIENAPWLKEKRLKHSSR